MAVEREEGYEYRGWKLGEKVKWKNNVKEYIIVGFDESKNQQRFIAINLCYWCKNIRKSEKVTSYIDTNSNTFDWVTEDEIEKIETDVNKEQEQLTDVLKLDYKEVFDKIACRIAYQDEDVLKRGKFNDTEIGVSSTYVPNFCNDSDDTNSVSWLTIKGIREDYDNEIFIVTKEEAEIIKEKVRKINEKYGVKRWRANEGEWYYCITSDIRQISYHENYYDCDDSLYKNGNYFKTKEQAEEASRRIKELLKKYHEEIGE